MGTNENIHASSRRTTNRKAVTYTKKDVARKVAQSSSEQVGVAEKWVNHVFDSLREIMMSADPELRIEIRDFGVFEIKRTKSKPKARNPRTGETIYVPPHLKSHFKPSKRLRTFLRQPVKRKENPEGMPVAASNVSTEYSHLRRNSSANDRSDDGSGGS